MLKNDEKREIEAEFRFYPDRPSACIEALRVVQRHRGWVSDEAVADVAGFLQMSPERVDSVATFYSLIFREPVGRHVVFVCDSVSCSITGHGRVQQHLREQLGVELGKTSADGRFTFLPIACLGTCDRAPAMMVDEDLHGDVSPGALKSILDRYR
jgi:NADH-quinone oxidoreductase subunit E